MHLPEGAQTCILGCHGKEPASKRFAVLLLGDLEQEPAIDIELLPDGTWPRRLVDSIP
jgi:hypothetical protein